MAAKEAKARIKINKLLEESGWRFIDDTKGKANIVLEPKGKLTKAAIDALGDNGLAASRTHRRRFRAITGTGRYVMDGVGASSARGARRSPRTAGFNKSLHCFSALERTEPD